MYLGMLAKSTPAKFRKKKKDVLHTGLLAEGKELRGGLVSL